MFPLQCAVEDASMSIELVLVPWITQTYCCELVICRVFVKPQYLALVGQAQIEVPLSLSSWQVMCLQLVVTVWRQWLLSCVPAPLFVFHVWRTGSWAVLSEPFGFRVTGRMAKLPVTGVESLMDEENIGFRKLLLFIWYTMLHCNMRAFISGNKLEFTILFFFFFQWQPEQPPWRRKMVNVFIHVCVFFKKINVYQKLLGDVCVHAYMYLCMRWLELKLSSYQLLQKNNKQQTQMFSAISINYCCGIEFMPLQHSSDLGFIFHLYGK